MTAISYLQNIYWREPLWLLVALQPLVIVLLKSLIHKNNISLYADNKLQLGLYFLHIVVSQKKYSIKILPTCLHGYFYRLRWQALERP